ncbi:MAG: hypothetical protein U0270_22270 [Labilithrix sp.]
MPQIRTGPANVTVTEPSTASFTVDAVGTAPLAYAWERKRASEASFVRIDPMVEPSAATATYTTGATTAATDDGMQLRAIVSNGSGSVTSTASVLSVQVAATTVTGPRDRRVAQGTTVDFTVLATPSAGRTYQWQRAPAAGGAFSDLVGATGSALSLGGVTVADAGRYRAIVSSAATAVTSGEARLTVVPLAEAAAVYVQNNTGVTENPALATQSTGAYTASADLGAGTFASTATSTATSVASYAGILRLRFFNTSGAPVTIAAGDLRAHVEGTYTHPVVPSSSTATTAIGVLGVNFGGDSYAARGDHQVTFGYDAAGVVTTSTNNFKKAVETNGATVVAPMATTSSLSMDLVMPAITLPPSAVMSVSLLLQTTAVRATCAFTTTPYTVTMKLPAGVTLDHDATVPLAWVTNLP